MNPRRSLRAPRSVSLSLSLCVALVGGLVAGNASAQTPAPDPAESAASAATPPAPLAPTATPTTTPSTTTPTTTPTDPAAPAVSEPVVAPVGPVVPAAPVETPVVATTPPGPRVDVEAEVDYRLCKERLQGAGPKTASEGLSPAEREVARACYASVIVKHQGTEAALKAAAGLVVFDALLRAPAQSGLEIPAGRLGISTTLGLFGVWNAVAGGILIGSNAPNLVDGAGLVAGTGAAAVALGIGAGVGGYFLADALQLDEGAARLVASGVVWGTVLGTAMAPSIAQLEGPAGFNLAIGGVVGAGYIGGGAALLLSSLVTFDEAQVGMINSGGLIGSGVGLLLLPNLASAGVLDTSMYSLTFIGSTMIGLTAGGIVGRTVNYTWGETLLCDLGAVLGVVAGGTVSVVAGMSGATEMPLLTAPPAVGLVGGYVVSALIVREWRASRGAPIWRDAPSVRPVAMAVPVGRTMVPTVGVMGTF